MKSTYTKYFQKSKVFLYPLLGLEKGTEFVPAETYICWEGIMVHGDERDGKAT